MRLIDLHPLVKSPSLQKSKTGAPIILDRRTGHSCVLDSSDPSPLSMMRRARCHSSFVNGLNGRKLELVSYSLQKQKRNSSIALEPSMMPLAQ
jgi:hypothetical protein